MVDCEENNTDYDMVKELRANHPDAVIIKVRFCKLLEKSCVECEEKNACNRNGKDNRIRCNEYGTILNKSKKDKPVPYQKCLKCVNFCLKNENGIEWNEVNNNNSDQHSRLPCRYMYILNENADVRNLKISFYGKEQQLRELNLMVVAKNDETPWNYEVDMSEKMFPIC